MNRPLETYPRVTIVQNIDDREVAWLKPFALVTDRYYHELPEGTYGEWGMEYLALVAIKGAEVVIGDAFTTWNPSTTTGLPQESIVGKYMPNLEKL